VEELEPVVIVVPPLAPEVLVPVPEPLAPVEELEPVVIVVSPLAPVLVLEEDAEVESVHVITRSYVAAR
jgi:hypothetical protein